MRSAIPALRQPGPGGFFENLFGGGTTPAAPDVPLAGTYRTLCVRTCDGYYFPVSYSTVPAKFADDEQLCQRMCPATEAVLYSHRNPGEDVAARGIGTGGLYTELPNAFSYRKAFNNACSCRTPGQSWATRYGSPTTRRSSAAISSSNRGAGQGAVAATADAQGKPLPASR